MASRMNKFNATRTELRERVAIAYNDCKRKKLVGDKAIDFIAARMFDLGEIAYREQYAPQKAAAAAERERFAAALGKPTSKTPGKATGKATGKASKPTGAAALKAATAASKASRASKPTGASKTAIKAVDEAVNK